MATAGNYVQTSDLSGQITASGGTYTGLIAAKYITVQAQNSTSGGTLKLAACTSSAVETYLGVYQKYWYISVKNLSNSTTKKAFNLDLSNGKGYFPTGSGGADYSPYYVSDYAFFIDYAEMRASDTKVPGSCLMETDSGIMTASNARLIGGCHILSDTYRCLIGKVNNGVAIGLRGRVLALPYRNVNEYKLGDCVCSAPNGTIDIMTKEEIKMYPECIIGTVYEIPKKQILVNNDISLEVNNRIWIKLK